MALSDVCQGHTQHTTRCLPLEDRDGREVALVVAKIAYRVAERGRVALLPRAEVRLTETRAHEGPWASVRHPSDLYDFKPGTDVLLSGSAHPPRAGAREVMVALRVAGRERLIEK